MNVKIGSLIKTSLIDFPGKVASVIFFQGCNFRCGYCYNIDVVLPERFGEPRKTEEVLDFLQKRKNLLDGVVLLGGEPLMQKETPDLAASLLDKGFSVLIETNGTQNIDSLPDNCHLIIDIKTPGSGENDKIKWSILNSIRKKDEVKFVLKDQTDYEWARDIVKQYSLGDRCPVLFSPVFGSLDLQPLAEWILSDRLPVRFQVQLHKLIWDPETRGV